MKSLYNRLKSLLLPIVALSAVAGIVQDLLLPLAKVGIKAGTVIILIGTIIILVKENSRLGQKIKEITDNWKYPLVVSMYLLGISVISLSVFSEQSGKDNGVLSSKFPALETVQSSLLGIEKKIDDTKKIVEENLKITQTVKIDTEQIKNRTKDIVNVSSNTLKNTDIIIKNTQKNAYEELVMRGLQPNDRIGFIRSVKESNWSEFTELMDIYKKANFNILTEVQMPDAIIEHDYNSDSEKTKSFFMPSKVHLIDVLLILRTDLKRMEYIFDSFNLDVKNLVSPIATAYGGNKYSQISFKVLIEGVTHPQIDIAMGDDINFSLISHQLKRNKNLTDKRGRYNLIHYIAMLNYQDYLDPLLRHGISINGTTYAGYTPLALAIENNNFNMVKILLERGAKFESGNNISIEIALIKALNPYQDDNNTGKYYTVSENPFFNLLIKNGISKYPKDIKNSVMSVYTAYFEHANTEYGSQDQRTQTYKNYLMWLKNQKV